MYLTKQIKFEAAHQLQSPAWKHSKCAEVHGHSWQVEVTVKGPVNPVSNSVMDFTELGALMKERVFEKLDHKFINDVLGVQDATSEYLCIWIWNQLWPNLRTDDCKLMMVKVRETESSWAVYGGD